MIEFFKNLEYGIDLAATSSILIAALSFVWQFAKQRKVSRNDEMWQYYKELTDEISEIKLEITDEISKELFFKEESTRITMKDLDTLVTRLQHLCSSVIFHLRLDTKIKIQNLLEYYSEKEDERDGILSIVDDTDTKLGRYVEEVGKKNRQHNSLIDEITTELESKNLDTNSFQYVHINSIYMFREYLKQITLFEKSEINKTDEHLQQSTSAVSNELTNGEHQENSEETANQLAVNLLENFRQTLFDENISQGFVEILNESNRNLLRKIKQLQ